MYMPWVKRLFMDEGLDVEPDDPDVVALCHVCGGEIYDGEVYGRNEAGKCICRDCINEEWSRLADGEKFELLGYEVII